MKTLVHASAFSSAAPSGFYDRWIDHDTWREWSPDCDWVRVGGPIAIGTRGVLKPTNGPKVRFVISALTPDREYTDTSRLPGARLEFQHLVSPVPEGSALEVTIRLSGPLSFLWSRILGPGFRKSAPEDLSRLVAIVETAGHDTSDSLH